MQLPRSCWTVIAHQLGIFFKREELSPRQLPPMEAIVSGKTIAAKGIFPVSKHFRALNPNLELKPLTYILGTVLTPL